MTDEKKSASKLTVEERIFLLLDDLNVRTQQILDLERSKIPKGTMESESITVNPPRFVIDVDSPTQVSNTRLRGPWLTINIANDGSADIKIFINDGELFDTLKPTENRDFNMIQRGKIRKVEIQTTSSASVPIRFVGLP